MDKPRRTLCICNNCSKVYAEEASRVLRAMGLIGSVYHKPEVY